MGAERKKFIFRAIQAGSFFQSEKCAAKTGFCDWVSSEYPGLSSDEFS
jgi:hypothetical protein